MKEVVILIGLQASGKSTFFRTQFAATHVHVSKDLLRNNSRPARRQRQLIEEALLAGHSVVIDNTNATLEERAELIQIAHQYQASVVGYYFDSRPGRCLERNRQREGRERVPDVAIFATLKRLVRPSYDEGFEWLYYVSLEDDGAFVVSEWDAEESVSEQ
ncbi:MAG: ATP-binding protein [Ktedonobacteraceae bacterium]|nr:ATP-binding protein [Ktedonobacteraceae bacterium]